MSLEEAIRLDCEDRVLDAAQAYEKIIEDNPDCEEAYINLAVLYWQSTKFEFSSPRNLDIDFVEKAIFSYGALLDVGYDRFGNDEFLFWRKYIDYMDLRGKPFENQCKQWIAADTEFHVPYMYLYTRSDGRQFQDQTRQLVQACQSEPTCKNRYIVEAVSQLLDVETPVQTKSADSIKELLQDEVPQVDKINDLMNALKSNMNK